MCFFFFQAEDGIRDYKVTGVQTCALPISSSSSVSGMPPQFTETNGRFRRSPLKCSARATSSFPVPLAPVINTVLRLEATRSEEHTSELQSPCNIVCRLLLEKKKIT